MEHRPYTHPRITLLNTTITSQLLADSERPGINTDNNVDTSGNPTEGDASGAHSKPFELDIEEVWETDGRKTFLGEPKGESRKSRRMQLGIRLYSKMSRERVVCLKNIVSAYYI